MTTKLREVKTAGIGTFADLPWWNDLPTAHCIPLRLLTPAELAALKTMTDAEFRKLAKAVEARQRKRA